MKLLVTVRNEKIKNHYEIIDVENENDIDTSVRKYALDYKEKNKLEGYTLVGSKLNNFKTNKNFGRVRYKLINKKIRNTQYRIMTQIYYEKFPVILRARLVQNDNIDLKEIFCNNLDELKTEYKNSIKNLIEKVSDKVDVGRFCDYNYNNPIIQDIKEEKDFMPQDINIVYIDKTSEDPLLESISFDIRIFTKEEYTEMNL